MEQKDVRVVIDFSDEPRTAPRRTLFDWRETAASGRQVHIDEAASRVVFRLSFLALALLAALLAFVGVL